MALLLMLVVVMVMVVMVMVLLMVARKSVLVLLMALAQKSEGPLVLVVLVRLSECSAAPAMSAGVAPSAWLGVYPGQGVVSPQRLAWWRYPASCPSHAQAS